MNFNSPKTIVLTGATGVVGTILSKHFASNDKLTLVWGVRDLKKAEMLKKDILAEYPNAKIILEQIDVLSIASIQSFAQKVCLQFDKIDVLINNAGAYFKQKVLTPEGIESTIQANFVAPLLLTQYLYSKLVSKKSSDPSYVIHMSTTVADDFDIHDPFFDERSYNGLRSFKQASGMLRALSTFTGQHAVKDNIIINATHPGTITSPLLSIAGFSRGLNTPEEILKNIMACFKGTLAQGGAYYRDGEVTPCEFSFNDALSLALYNKLKSWLPTIDAEKFEQNAVATMKSVTETTNNMKRAKAGKV